MTPPGVTLGGATDDAAAPPEGDAVALCDEDSLVGDKDALNLCKASKLSLSHSLVYCKPSRLFSTK